MSEAMLEHGILNPEASKDVALAPPKKPEAPPPPSMGSGPLNSALTGGLTDSNPELTPPLPLLFPSALLKKEPKSLKAVVLFGQFSGSS